MLRTILEILVPALLYVDALRTLQLSSAETIQAAIIAILMAVAFWVLFTAKGIRYGFARSALQEWLTILYLLVMGVFIGLHFGVREDHADLGQLYRFIAMTMACLGWLYYVTIFPFLKRRNALRNELSRPKN